MTFQVRRVVTGHDSEGKAIVMTDEIMTQPVSFRPGMNSYVAWATDRLPADNACERPAAATSTTVKGGSVFRIIEFLPGVTPRNHRTDSLDYAVVLSGEIDMELDECVVHLKAGDLLVQRGTVHNWVNRGTQPCVIVFSLLASEPFKLDGNALPAVG